MAQFLYILRAVRPEMVSDGPDAREAGILSEHTAYLGQLADQGTVILAGRTQVTGPDTMGLVIFEATDEPSACELMRSDPAVAGGIMSADLYPYAIAVSRNPDA